MQTLNEKEIHFTEKPPCDIIEWLDDDEEFVYTFIRGNVTCPSCLDLMNLTKK